jgi:hypothetical protein
MHDRTREMAKDGTLMQFGRRSRGKLFGFAGMEIEGATELLEKCKAKGVLHKAEAEFIKGFASDMILFPGPITHRSSTPPWASRRKPIPT